MEKDVDILLWDSSMTEKGDISLGRLGETSYHGGDRVPMLLSGSRNVLPRVTPRR
jgi:hypothetical protein